MPPPPVVQQMCWSSETEAANHEVFWCSTIFVTSAPAHELAFFWLDREHGWQVMHVPAHDEFGACVDQWFAYFQMYKTSFVIQFLADPDLLQQFLPSLQKTRSEHLKVHQHILLFEEAPAFRLYQRYIL